MENATTNKSLLIKRPGTDEVILVVAVVLDPETLDIERLLSALVPEMVRGEVRGGLLVIADSTLVLRFVDREMQIDEVDTSSLLALAGIDESWSPETLPLLFEQWIDVLRQEWRSRMTEPLRQFLVPHLVAGLAGELEIVEGIWGLHARRRAGAEGN